MAALDLRKGLSVEVVVVEGKTTFARDEEAALLPARDLRDELVRGRQLDVDFQLVLDLWEGAEEPVGLRLHLDVHVDGAHPPAQKDRGRTSCEVEADIAFSLPPQLLHEAVDPLRVYRPAHSAAFSKLTSRRRRALYRECAESESVSASRS